MKPIIFIIVIILVTTSSIHAIVLSPDNTISLYLDDKLFYSRTINTMQIKNTLKITIETNYPGPNKDIHYNIADVNIEGNRNIAIQLSTGKVILAKEWQTSELFYDIVIYGRHLDGSFIPVLGHGEHIGQAKISWTEVNKDDYLITIILPLSLLDSYGIFGLLKIAWATALCGNSFVSTVIYYVPTVYPIIPVSNYPLIYYPSITGTRTNRVPLPPSLLLFGSGILYMWCRKHFFL